MKYKFTKIYTPIALPLLRFRLSAFFQCQREPTTLRYLQESHKANETNESDKTPTKPSVTSRPSGPESFSPHSYSNQSHTSPGIQTKTTNERQQSKAIGATQRMPCRLSILTYNRSPPLLIPPPKPYPSEICKQQNQERTRITKPLEKLYEHIRLKTARNSSRFALLLSGPAAIRSPRRRLRGYRPDSGGIPG